MRCSIADDLAALAVVGAAIEQFLAFSPWLRRQFAVVASAGIRQLAALDARLPDHLVSVGSMIRVSCEGLRYPHTASVMVSSTSATIPLVGLPMLLAITCRNAFLSIMNPIWRLPCGLAQLMYYAHALPSDSRAALQGLLDQIAGCAHARCPSATRLAPRRT